ncbi:Hypothetical predicted protein [Lecanosticta acicola]|uniref:Uncharacterized protein n=1 Tax=Lecanosticta acicola TaxID=111012 RepID=A0AAI9E8A5_9PEZI|nr:Hypothetical predicted protein [Lecanosticta acicola]
MSPLPSRPRPQPRALFRPQQTRTFLGLQRTPAPKPQMMGYLVLQGLAVVLLADLTFATVSGETTTIRSVAQSAGFWKEQEFGEVHGKEFEEKETE